MLGKEVDTEINHNMEVVNITISSHNTDKATLMGNRISNNNTTIKASHLKDTNKINISNHRLLNMELLTGNHHPINNMDSHHLMVILMVIHIITIMEMDMEIVLHIIAVKVVGNIMGNKMVRLLVQRELK